MKRTFKYLVPAIFALLNMGCSKSNSFVEIFIHHESDATHVWCEGAELAKGDHRPSDEAAWTEGEGGVWHTFHCVRKGSSLHQCTTIRRDNTSLRFQCHVGTRGEIQNVCTSSRQPQSSSVQTNPTFTLAQGRKVNVSLCQVD